MITEPLKLNQIHAAMNSSLRSAQGSGSELAAAVRDCCNDLPIGTPLMVAGHRLEWVEAECIVAGGRQIASTQMHCQPVMLLDGKLVPEEPVEVEYEDSWDGPFTAWYYGPEAGWFRAGEHDKCERCLKQLWDEGPGHDDFPRELPKPQVLAACPLADLREVARALPEAMGPWQVSRQEAVEEEVQDTRNLEAALRQQPQAMMTDLLRRVRQELGDDPEATRKLARETSIEVTALSQCLSGARPPTAFTVLALQGWLARRQHRA